MRYGYLDESGNTAPFQPDQCFLAVAVVAGTYGVARYLQYRVKKLRQKARTPPREELKASLATPRQRERLLLDIASEDVAIVAVILDKRGVRRAPSDPEVWYREVVSLAVWHCAKRWPSLALTLDKRYNSPALRDRLEKTVRARLAGLDATQVALRQVDSRACLGLQAADFVAWSIARKYEVADRGCYDLVRRRIVVEEIVKAR